MTALRLGVNVDHVATVRNARGGAVPDPVRAALLAIEAGADGITAHLREDRRHIHDDDMTRLKASIGKPLNFEMAATDAMLDIALKIRPHACCLVPEKRTERTTEGGLDVVGGFQGLEAVRRRTDAGGNPGVDVHRTLAGGLESQRRTRRAGRRAPHRGLVRRAGAGRSRQGRSRIRRLRAAAAQSQALGLECHAGHGLDYDTARLISALPQIVELNIGHFLIGEAIFVGLAETVKAMRMAMTEGRASVERGPLIVGIGSDLCDIERIERTLARYGERFIDRCFTETEQRRSDRRAARAASYAKRFAAKEACAKALGTGLRRGVFWRDMGVVNLPSGQPTMHLTGGAAERLRAILPPGTEPFIHLTITDEKALRPGVRGHRGPRREPAWQGPVG